MSWSSLGNGGQGPPFTVAQWAEMEHQALIFKYFKAGMPVPPDLLAPIRSSFNLSSPDFLRYHPILGYSNYGGKKIDPEPGRCRRTDGKKWRCSKDAHPDSKYCERHMNRGRSRSRKLVESQTTSRSRSTMTSDSMIGSCSHSGSFQNMSLQSLVNTGGQCFGGDVAQLKMESIPYGIANTGTRGRKGAEEHNFMSEASGNVRSLGMDSTVDSPWRLMVPQVPLKSELRNSSLFLNSSSQLQTFQDVEPLSVDAAISEQQQRQYVGEDFGLPASLKHSQNSLQPFFDEWPKSRDPVYHQNDHRSTDTLSNMTHLSMSNAKAPSKFFMRSAESPDDAYT